MGCYKEETYWFKRSPENWLLKGDGNTEFFHPIVNERKRQSKILCLEENGSKIEGEDEILKHASDYCSNLFGPALGNLFTAEQDIWPLDKNLSEEENEILCKPFSEEEIKHALFEMEKNKAAGPDKIPAEFYQHCWEIVKRDIVEIFRDFHENKMDVSRMNYGVITLIPKTKDAIRIQQFQPICLLIIAYIN